MNNDNPAWQYITRVYSASSVSYACLQLQDCDDADVVLLLFYAWLASQGLKLSFESHHANVRLVRMWRDEMIKPLRTIRQYWKPMVTDDEVSNIFDITSMRDEVKRLELQAEKQQLDALYKLYIERHPSVVSAVVSGNTINFEECCIHNFDLCFSVNDQLSAVTQQRVLQLVDALKKCD